MSQSQLFEVAVAHYGHHALKGRWHWAIVVMFGPDSSTGLAYQIVGNSSSYEFGAIKSIDVDDSRAYKGRVSVGHVNPHDLPAFGKSISTGRIIHNDPQWGCQRWVVERLNALRDEGFLIEEVTHSWLLERLKEEAQNYP